MTLDIMWDYLTRQSAGLKYPKFRKALRSVAGQFPGFMTPTPSSPVPDKRSKMNQCKHPRVQIVSREEDAEFVECLECGEIFESSEFKDMAIEDSSAGSDI